MLIINLNNKALQITAVSSHPGSGRQEEALVHMVFLSPALLPSASLGADGTLAPREIYFMGS